MVKNSVIELVQEILEVPPTNVEDIAIAFDINEEIIKTFHIESTDKNDSVH